MVIYTPSKPFIETLTCESKWRKVSCALAPLEVCSENDLTELDVTTCTELQQLHCSYNKFTELDVTNSIGLLVLGCSYCSLTELDIKNLTELLSLDCGYNNLSKLDITRLYRIGRAVL